MERVAGYVVVSDDTYQYTTGYFTARKWTKNGDIILARFIDEEQFENDLSELVYYSVDKKCVTRVLCDDVNNLNYVVYNDMVYYCTKKELKSINLETREIKTIYEFGDETYILPHITNDGNYINFINDDENRNGEVGKFLMVNVETNEPKLVFTKDFPNPFYIANHGMVCPTNPDLTFFAHEGTTQYVTNRLWIHDSKTGKMRNIVKQEMTEDGDLGEYFGHEMWAPDGKGLYFVKYPQSPIKPTGLCYVDLESGKKEVLFSKYAYWHVSTSEDGKYLMGDTMRGVYDGTDLSEVVLADLEKNTEEVIDVVHSTGRHPCHPHPSISSDSKVVAYNAFEDGKIVVKLALLK